jgi:hypothetical protein
MSETWYMVVGLLLILSTIVGWGFILYNLVSFAITGISESQRKIEVRFIVLIKAFGLYVLLGVLLATPIWLVEIVPAKRAVVHTERNDGVRVAQSFQSATIMWQWDWDKLMAGPRARVVDYNSRTADISMNFHPITDNPKVRSLRYVISASTGDSPQDLVALENSSGRVATHPGYSDDAIKPWVAERVRYLLYEFNEKNSKQLAVLYNPLDQSQQVVFRKMVEDSLAGPLHECGMYLQRVRFEIGD